MPHPTDPNRLATTARRAAGRRAMPRRAMPRRAMPRWALVGLAALLAALALLAGCGEEDSGPATHAPAVTVPGGAAADTSTATDRGAEHGPADDGTAAPADPAPPQAEPTATTGVIARADLPLVAFDRARGGTVTLPVEVVPADEFGIGLSGRYALDERGMVFYYPDPALVGGFWMQHTHIDLAIAFADAEGLILAIEEMEAESLEIVRPVERYTFAIEAPSGWFARHDIAPGDRVRLRFDLDDWYPDHR